MPDRSYTFSVVAPIIDDDLGAAETISSVLAQAGVDFEILIAGQSTTIFNAIKKGLADDRARLIETGAINRAAVLNSCLATASGHFIAYLEPGSWWASDFLATMAATLNEGDIDCACARVDFRNGDILLAQRGGQFEWPACLEADLIPLSAFCHRRELFNALGGFDETLPRPDWDLVLRFTKRGGVAFSPSSRCEYRGAYAVDRLVGPPLPHAWKKLVQARNTLDLFREEQRSELARAFSLKFAIKISALRGREYKPYREWGDFQFADALKEALERLGHQAFIDPTWNWYEPRPEPDDVVVVIRGLMPYDPQPNSINFLWNINHAEDLLPEEYESYDLVYVGSQSYAALLATMIETPVLPLLQATDPSRFHPLPPEQTVTGGLRFIGNARREYRRMVRWAIDEGLDPEIYGTGWSKIVPPAAIRGEFIDNRDLVRFYAGARVLLNDHFESMRDFGLVSNRAFDVVASGGTLVSDHIPSIARLFGSAVRTVHDRASLGAAVQEALANPRPPEDIAASAEKVARQHNFDERAKAIAGDVLERLALVTDVDARQTHAARRRQRGLTNDPVHVHAIVRIANGSPDDSAFVRLIAPLTQDRADFFVTFGDDTKRQSVRASRVCVVQIGAFRERSRFDALLAEVGTHHTAVVVDVDRGPESEIDIRLMRAADQIWFATPRLLAENGIPEAACHVVPGGIEPRFWKEYPPPAPHLAGNRPLRFLLVDRSGTGEDFALLLPVLDALAAQRPGEFNVAIVGVASPPGGNRPWLHRMSPPVAAGPYPRFARWLRSQGPFDVGLLPAVGLSDLQSERRLLEFSALGTLTVVSDAVALADGSALDELAVTASDPTAWFEALARILSDPSSFVPVAAAAVAYTWNERANDSVASRHAQLMAGLPIR